MADCDVMLASMPGVPLNDFQSFESSCQELHDGPAQLMLQPVAVQMFRVLIDTEGAAQSGSMFPGGGTTAGGGDVNGQPLDPLQPLPPVPPPPPADTTAGSGYAMTGVTQYHAECTSADVASCVPACDTEHHGFELLATIDGSDTKLSCELHRGLFSWVGSAVRSPFTRFPEQRGSSRDRAAVCRLTAAIWVPTSSRSSLPWSPARCGAHSVSVDMISS
jgi:hypothetical protein